MSFIAGIQANIDDFSRNLDKAQARLDVFSDTVGSKIEALGSKFQKVGTVMSLALTTSLTAIGKASYDFAADFEDALGATDQIFTESADGVKKWANDLETYFGISKKEALEYSNLMGSMLVNIGNLTEDQAAKQGAKLIELAGDLTAMYGGQTQDAVRALTGALKGNNTMLDNYGMAVNDAIVKARALELGLVAQGKEMSLSAKQAATLSLIYEQSAAAQGQAAREAEGASGTMRAWRTEITNLSTELGDVLLPIITPIISRLKDIASGFRDLSPEAKKAIVIIGGVVAAIGPLLIGLGSIMKLAPLVGTAFAAMTGPIGIAVTAITAAAVLIVKNWDSVSTYFTTGGGSKMFESIKNSASNLWTSLSNVFNQIKTTVLDIWEKIGSNVKSIFSNSFNIVLAIVEGAIGAISGVLNVFASLLKGDFKGAVEGVKQIFTSVFGMVQKVVVNALAVVSQSIAGFLKWVGADSLGSSLENWANGLIPVEQETKQLAVATGNVTDAIVKKTTKLKELQPELEKTKKDTRNYRQELVELFANWGYYESQVTALTTKFKEYADIAKKAGASTVQMATIMREQLGERLELALNQFDLKAVKPKILIDTDINIDTDEIGQKMKVAVDKTQKEVQKLKSSFDFLTIDLGSSLGEMASSAMEGLGQALANGVGVVDAIGKSLLATLGSLAVSVGKQMMAFGAAALGLQTLIKNPFTAIAAGAALVALGSFASASVSKTVSSATSGGGSSYSSTSSSAIDRSQFRGALYNNDKQVVELVLKNTQLSGAITLNNNRNNRLG